jgi:hypothetical protein
MAPAKKKPSKPSAAPPDDRPAPAPPKYVPTRQEKAALERFKKLESERPPAPHVNVEQQSSNPEGFSFDHVNKGVSLTLLSEAIGTADPDFLAGMFTQLLSAASHGGKISEIELNFLLSTIKDIKPRDQLESMLAAQMGVVHMSIMTFNRRLENAATIPQQDSALNGFIKLMRTFAGHVEALKRYRTGGEQKVTVQHVNVGEGGQAIVGNITTQSSRAASPSQAADAAPTLTHSAEAPMPLVRETVASPVAKPKKRKNGRGSSA